MGKQNKTTDNYNERRNNNRNNAAIGGEIDHSTGKAKPDAIRLLVPIRKKPAKRIRKMGTTSEQQTETNEIPPDMKKMEIEQDKNRQNRAQRKKRDNRRSEDQHQIAATKQEWRPRPERSEDYTHVQQKVATKTVQILITPPEEREMPNKKQTVQKPDAGRLQAPTRRRESNRKVQAKGKSSTDAISEQKTANPGTLNPMKNKYDRKRTIEGDGGEGIGRIETAHTEI